MATRSGVLSVTAGAALLLLAACSHESQDQMSWARAALERNAQVEVVAADQQSRTFTVRVKDTGELRMVRADEVVAAPAALAASAPGKPAMLPSAPPAAIADSNTAVPAPVDAAPAGDNTAALAQASHAGPVGAEGAEMPGGKLLETGPGYSIKAASPAPAGSGMHDNQVLSGPGYSVKATAPAVPAGSGRIRDAAVTSAVLERRHEPIVCQGSRLLHIDNRNLQFDGDAVSAQDGCEIHITNSHITATGVGVLARAASVHIDNSQIEGDAGSIDASEGAQVYAASSHFRGLSRRLDSASFHDLGGNIWN